MRSILIAGFAAVLVASPAAAQEITLRAVSSFAEGTEFSKNFERFIEKVNNDGKGILKINYIGGPRAVPPFEVGNAVRTRVVDIANVTGAYYTNLMPEADGFKLNGKPMSEQRKNGTWDYINQLHNHKLNSQYLARQFHNVPFHIYLNKRIEKIDFSGLKVRVTPVYRDIVEALAGTPVTTAPGEVYTALERGVVDGYGWPITGIFDLGWDKVTKFRMEPPFYSVEVNVLVNLDSWKGLNDAQRKVLNDAALWLEGLDSEKVAVIKAERERQAAAGIQALDFGPAASKGFLDRAYDVAWQLSTGCPDDVMAGLVPGLVPAIHVWSTSALKDVDARHKAGHDASCCRRAAQRHDPSLCRLRPAVRRARDGGGADPAGNGHCRDC
jgi:TRAP-type C4-dicarboxylate transport system substrate-binding protein